jgi:hypothetical protein
MRQIRIWAQRDAIALSRISTFFRLRLKRGFFIFLLTTQLFSRCRTEDLPQSLVGLSRSLGLANLPGSGTDCATCNIVGFAISFNILWSHTSSIDDSVENWDSSPPCHHRRFSSQCLSTRRGHGYAVHLLITDWSFCPRLESTTFSNICLFSDPEHQDFSVAHA